MSPTSNKWWSVANFYHAIDFNYVLNHLNRANKFKLRGFYYGSGHVHLSVCSVCDFENKSCHSRSLTVSAIESKGSYKTFFYIIKMKAFVQLQDWCYHRNPYSEINKMLLWGKRVTSVTQVLFHSPSQPPTPSPWGRLLYLEPADVICDASSFLHIHSESNNFMTRYDSVGSHVTWWSLNSIAIFFMLSGV